VVETDRIVSYLDDKLSLKEFEAERGGNGLLYHAGDDVTRLASACTSTLNTIEQAASNDCEFLIVHHPPW
jgi:putative NIF3 family GTP cyclohydrolase 1 type 2